MHKQPCIHGAPDINGCGMCRLELRRNPDMDVRTLWATGEAATEDAHGWAEQCRAAIRQGRHAQAPLSS